MPDGHSSVRPVTVALEPDGVGAVGVELPPSPPQPVEARASESIKATVRSIVTLPMSVNTIAALAASAVRVSVLHPIERTAG